MVNGRKSGACTGIRQFAGNFQDLNGNSNFNFLFYKNGNIFVYGFTLDHYQIQEEWLLKHIEDDFVPIFTRSTSIIGETTVNITQEIAPEKRKQRELSMVLKESMQEKQKNLLFLGKLSENGITIAEHVVEWFRNISVFFPDTRYFQLRLKEGEINDFRNYIEKKLLD